MSTGEEEKKEEEREWSLPGWKETIKLVSGFFALSGNWFGHENNGRQFSRSLAGGRCQSSRSGT